MVVKGGFISAFSSFAFTQNDENGSFSNMDGAFPRKEQRRFVCHVCGKGFVLKTDLKRHSLIHSGEKPFVCPFCPHRSNRKGNMNTHIIENILILISSLILLENPCQGYSTDWTTTIPYDGKSIRRGRPPRSSTHSGLTSYLREWNCPYCGKMFKDPSNLRRHKMIHTGEKPFRCPHCDYVANRKFRVICHIKALHGDVGGEPVQS
ncbi:Zinc finger protein [Armadillidium nasatum]|uniref:Zinc finger protein n=1 Tax=Armadillidium nasatum TaxID=96803 RepID=A0A5N5SJI3_9CRUS|nr:Zinc finger protein [Armadillidium nasatum]